MDFNQKNFKEQRIKKIKLIYYSQQLIKKTIYEFSKNRECIARYYEGFGKRPDVFQYEQDILEQVKRGATSFHCSEELWKDPLEISTELSKEQFNELRIGWDLLLDIDSPYLEYSKIYTELLIKTLKFYNIENIGIKFSGNKGFHIIIPWEAFPKKIYNQKTKDMFPEWPRIICEYLSEIIKPKLGEEILKNESSKQIALKTGKKEEELIIIKCLSCNRPASKKFLVTWICPYCNIEREMPEKNKRIPKCPECQRKLIEKLRQETYFCEFCDINSKKYPELFEKRERFATEKLIEADLILVAPRHLFRMPYSLHEKTALSSIVIDKDKINNFQITDAQPFKGEIKNFYPKSKPEEAKELLLQALDWKEQEQIQEKNIKKNKDKINERFPEKQKSNYKKIIIENPSDEIIPPSIKTILKGIKQDGRKRALFIILSFFKFLGVSENNIEKRIYEWNEKNYIPLKKGYIQSQLNWYKKSSLKMPPNYSNPIYNDLAILHPEEIKFKNPINFAIKKYFQMKK